MITIHRSSWITPLALVMSLAFAPIGHAGGYSIVSLGTLPGDNASGAIQITNNGSVLCSTPDQFAYALWNSSTGLKRLPLSDENIILRGINDSGTTVGWRHDSSVAVVVDANGQISDLLGPDGYTGTWAHAINDAGMVVGSWPDSPLLWQPDGTPLLLADVGSASLGALAISDNGMVVYQLDDFVSGEFQNRRSYIWKPDGSIQRLDQLSESDGISSGGYAINNLGQVVGSTEGHAVLWNSDGSIAADLGVGSALDINNLGQIVGHQGGHAVMWEPDGSIVQLPILDGWSGIGMYLSINDRGQIAGTLNNWESDTYSMAAIWQPVPEPSSLLVLAGGLGFLGVVIQRRRH